MASAFEELKLQRTVTRAHGKGGILNLRLTIDSCHAVTCGQDRQLVLWNPWKGLRIKAYDHGHHGAVLDCSIAANKSMMLSAGEQDKYGLSWDISTGKIIRRVGSHDLGLTTCLLIANDTVAMTASVDKTVAFWDLRDRQSRRPIQVLADAYDTVTGLKKIGDEIMTTSLDGFFRRYDIRKGRLTCDFLHHPLTSFETAHSTDAQCVAVMSLGGLITLVDTSLSEKGRNATLNYFEGVSNQSGTMKCAIDLDDSFVFASSEDGCIYVWDIATETATSHVSVIKEAHDGHQVNGVCMINDNDETRRKARLKSEGFLEEPAHSGFEETAMTNRSLFTYGQDGSFRIWG